MPENVSPMTFDRLADMVFERVGFRLFTIMEIDQKSGVARRSYSNMPNAYPVTGEKPLQMNAWSECVRVRQQIFVANSITQIAEVFPDYAHIQALGCESCINLPIVVAGEVIGTLNCLHEAGYYTPDRIEAAQSLAQAGASALLGAQTNPKEKNYG